MTDHGRIALTNDFYRACKENGINPIIGCEFYVSKGKYDDKSPENKSRWHITVLAKNNQGVKNLYHLTYLMNKYGFYYKPRIDDELLFKYKEGLIVLSGCAGSEINSHLRRDEGYEYDFDKAVEVAKRFKEEFGDDYYLELQDHILRSTGKMWTIQESLNKDLTKISKMLGIKRVLSADCHYVNPEDEEAHEVLLCIGTGKFLSDTDRMSLKEFDLSLKSPKDLYERWKDDIEVLENTLEINNKVHIEFNLDEQAMPEFKVPMGMSMIQYLKYLSYNGLVKRLVGDFGELSVAECIEKLLPLNKTFHGQNFTGKDIIERLEMELSIVNKIKVPGYFLIVQEYINWAKSHGIRVGCGRGSSLASLMCYATRITEVNPLGIKGFMFERFLNPDRISLPDVDTDFEARYREKVIQHFRDIYGDDHVIGIGVQTTLRSKNAVRDVARVLEFPFQDSLELTKLLPAAEHTGAPKLHEYIMSDEELQKLYDDPEKKCETPEFRERYLNDPKVKKIVDIAIKLEGKQRNHGLHACGTVISPEPIWEYFPTEISNDVMASACPMHDIEEGGVNEKGGLLKIDVLGLSTLDLISDTLKLIKKTKGIEVDIDNVNLEDEETLKNYREGKLNDTFTFSSAGMIHTLKGLKVDKFSDLVLVNAMFRPGAMDYIGDAIAVKNGEKQPRYWFGQEELLKETYGIIAYQEQGMEIAKFMGFTGGETDNMRKALAKKNKGFLDMIFPTFKEKALSKGFTEKEVDEYWESLIGFSRYSFNKAHAYAYAVVGYQTGYLKTHYPVEYYAAYLNHVSGDKEKLGEAIKNAKKTGLTITQPDVLVSETGFTADSEGRIVYGLNAIKGFGKVGEVIIENRKNRRIETLRDFFDVFATLVPRKKLEILAEAGAFDNLCKKDKLFEGSEGRERAVLLYNFDLIYNTYNPKKKKKAKKTPGQISMFDDTQFLEKVELQLNIPKHDDVIILEGQEELWYRYCRKILLQESELLGNFVSENPLDHFAGEDDLQWQQTLDAEEDKLDELRKLAKTPYELGKIKNRLTFKRKGIIIKVRTIKTKTGKKMCFCSVNSGVETYDMVVFPTQYEIFKDKIKPMTVFVGDVHINRDYDKNRTEEDEKHYSFILENGSFYDF